MIFSHRYRGVSYCLVEKSVELKNFTPLLRRQNMTKGYDQELAKYAIRPMIASDIATVERLITATGLFPPELLVPMVEPYLSQSNHEDNWAVVDLNEPIGVAYWVPERMTSGTWNMLLIAVHPNRQRQGIGAAIVDYIEKQLSINGQRMLLVETSGVDQFEPTRNFYTSCGYSLEARIHDFYDVGEDKLIFRKLLKGACHGV